MFKTSRREGSAFPKEVKMFAVFVFLEETYNMAQSLRETLCVLWLNFIIKVIPWKSSAIFKNMLKLQGERGGTFPQGVKTGSSHFLRRHIACPISNGDGMCFVIEFRNQSHIPWKLVETTQLQVSNLSPWNMKFGMKLWEIWNGNKD